MSFVWNSAALARSSFHVRGGTGFYFCSSAIASSYAATPRIMNNKSSPGIAKSPLASKKLFSS